MPKWSKDETEFEVNVHYNKEKGSQVRVPKPVLEKMDNPVKVKFIVNGKNVKVIPVSKRDMIAMRKQMKKVQRK